MTGALPRLEGSTRRQGPRRPPAQLPQGQPPGTRRGTQLPGTQPPQPARPHLRGRADHGDVRRANLALVLRELRAGPRTRTRLAADTTLTKATVSSLVTELAGRGLARSREPTRAGGVGRPGQRVELVGARVIGIGLELNVDYLAAVALDLAGQVKATVRKTFDVPADLDDTVAAAVSLVGDLAGDAVAADGVLAGVGVAAPGLIDLATGVVRVAPNLEWRDVPLLDLLRDRLGGGLEPRPGWPDLALSVDNEANLATLAEFAAARDTESRDLVCITGGVGVGGGIVVDGRVVRGHAGFAGEVGHLAVAADGEQCGCGRRGCWETLCGLGTLLRLAADPGDPVHDHDTDLDERLGVLLRRAHAGDRRTLRALDQVGRALGHGASMLVNLVNPSVLVLGGYFVRLGDYLVPAVEAELASRVVAPDSGGCRVELSRLGLAAAATGAAYAALQPVLDDPTVVPVPDQRPGLSATQRREIG
jgi:predicted NBD/HSP70 family sugar kinase